MYSDEIKHELVKVILERFPGASFPYKHVCSADELALLVKIPQFDFYFQFTVDFREPFVYCLLIKNGLEDFPWGYVKDGQEIKVHLQEMLSQLGCDCSASITRLRLASGKIEYLNLMMNEIADLIIQYRDVLNDGAYKNFNPQAGKVLP